jgi:hypothetical protein
LLLPANADLFLNARIIRWRRPLSASADSIAR